MKFIGLDSVDEAILNLLIQNARASYTDIAKEIGLTSAAVKNRIFALESKGIIDGYSVIINPQRIENMSSVYLDIQAQPCHLEAIIAMLEADENITQIYLLSGSGRLHVHGTFRTGEMLDSFLRKKLYPMEGLLDVRCDMIFSRIKDTKVIRL